MNDETGTTRPGEKLPPVRGDVASPVEPTAPARLVPEVRLCAPSGSDSRGGVEICPDCNERFGRGWGQHAPECPQRYLGTQKQDTKRTLTPANSHILFPFCTE
jgi:hypothetical protein